ncbi:MAG TPA: DUF4391 domain-containing protein [Candidatus Saccharimonadales bacterium]|nr:DUF4391 domain-containing protein [Candidatus Saccharimonadales bacterium]
MSFAPIIQALALPPETRVEQRVPKKLLVENGAPTAADKRQINDGIEEILWHAALKPANLGVPAYRDAVREYLEIAIITVTCRLAAKPIRLVELIHRAIPYPVLLAAQQGEGVSLSVAHKRWSQGEIGKVVIEELRATAPFLPESPAAEEAQFLARLPVGDLPQRDLFALYQGWLDSVLALEAAQITGAFTPPSSSERSMMLRENLDARIDVVRELAVLRAQAEKETQLNRRVELNLAIKSLNARIAEFDANL